MDRTRAEERVHELIAQLDSLLEGAEAAARLVACGKAAVPPLREFLIDGQPRGVYQPRLWAVQALGGLGADDVLIEYLRRPIASSDAVARLGEQVVRSAAAKALTESDHTGARDAIFEAAVKERLPGALDALAHSHPDLATPVLIEALGDDFAREAAQAALRRLGPPVRHALIDTAFDPGSGTEHTLRRRRAALELLTEIGIDGRDWQSLQQLLDETDPPIVCAVALLGVESSPDPARIAGRLLEILPHVGWEWLGTVEDVVVRCAERAGDSFRPLLPPDAFETHQRDVLWTWKRICRRLHLRE